MVGIDHLAAIWDPFEFGLSSVPYRHVFVLDSLMFGASDLGATWVGQLLAWIAYIVHHKVRELFHSDSRLRVWCM